MAGQLDTASRGGGMGHGDQCQRSLLCAPEVSLADPRQSASFPYAGADARMHVGGGGLVAVFGTGLEAGLPGGLGRRLHLCECSRSRKRVVGPWTAVSMCHYPWRAGYTSMPVREVACS